MKQFNKKLSMSTKIIIAFVFGALWMIALRFVTYSPEVVHYHANFAVFVDGQRQSFDSPLLFEEVQSCGSDDEYNPKTRVHMHDGIDSLVHVHDAGATWGHFFANIGMTNGDSVVRLPGGTYSENDRTKIQFMLNGEKVFSTANVTIRSEDRLLISIGSSDDSELKAQYAQIESDASEYNQKSDPSSCSGSASASFSERLKHAVGITTP
jgi:hypothetical protein